MKFAPGGFAASGGVWGLFLCSVLVGDDVVGPEIRLEHEQADDELDHVDELDAEVHGDHVRIGEAAEHIGQHCRDTQV